ncbi:MAG: PIN domain-containing protein [Chloroflexota bacterium]|nr:PIN domain-containing protein [Chloroflexota bacterium]
MASRPPKVFLDTSVLMAATISARGSARDLVNRGLRGAYALIISSDVIEECERNLRAKAPDALPLFMAFLTLLTHRAEPTAEQVAQAAMTIEAKDAPIVAAAALVKADYLASYDRRHLLAKRAEIEAAYGIVTTTPDEILRGRAQ